jgi:hypothetical protein
MGNIDGGAGGERVTCKGSAELEVGNIVPGVFTPVLAKPSKSFSLFGGSEESSRGIVQVPHLRKEARPPLRVTTGLDFLRYSTGDFVRTSASRNSLT